jgi:PTS system mannose-specific IIA component
MIGLIVTAHGRLAEELLGACEMIVGQQPQVCAVGIGREDDVEQVRDRLQKAIAEVGRDGDGVLILTDMFGGSPANLSLAFLDPGKVEVLTGVNLPMVLKLFGSREELALPDLAAQLKTHGQQSIFQASEFLQKPRA